MKKFFFRRRSISYRGRGNFATQLSFSQPIVKLAVWLYFIICILVICTRVFFMTQADHYRDEITALVSEAAGVDVHAGEFSAGFERFWPVITVRQLELARPGGPVSLTLPEVKARLAWSSLWHFEPRFQLLRISSPDLRITRLDKTTLDIAGFVVNLPEGSDEESDFAASGDSRVAAWLLAQKKLELVNGTITYDDRYSPGAAEVRVMNANVVFEQTLLDWRVAVDGTAHISAEESPHKQGECFTAVARIDRHIFTDTSNPLTWKGQVYVRFSHADVAKLLSRAGFPQFMSSGSGAAEVWAGFADGRITSATADVALLDIHTQLADNLEPLKLAWLESRLYYNGSFGDRAEQTFGVRKLDFMTADRRRLKPTDASVTIRTDSAGQISDGAITVSRLDIGSLIALVPELPLDDAVRSFVTAHAPEGYLKDVSVAFSGNPSDPGNWRPAATFKDLSLKAADGIPGIRAISGSISPLKNGEGFKVVLDSPKSTLSFPSIFRHPDMKFDTLKATAEIVPHPTLTVRLPSFEASNPDAALKGSGSWQATGGPGTLELNGTISRARATAVPYYIPLVVGDDVLDWLEAGILGGSGSNGTFIVKGPLEHFPWDGKHKNDGHFAIEADMTGGRLDFLPSHVRKADGSWETASSWPVLNNIDAHLAFIGNGFEIRGQSATSHDLKASDVVVSMKSYTDADLEITGRAQGDLGRVLRYLNQGRMLNDILSSAFAESKGSGAADVRMNLHIPLSGDIVRNLRVNIDADIRNATFYYGLNLPTVSGVNGSLHITEKSVVTPAPLTGTSPGGKPVKVTAETKDGVMTLGIDAERHDAVLRFGGDLDGLAAGTRAREGRGRDDALFRDVQAPIDARDRRQVEAVVEGGVADVRIDVDAQVSDDVAGKGNMKVHAHVGGARTFAFGERGGEDVVEHPALIEIAEHAAEVSLGAARDLQIGVRVGLHADDDVACLEVVRGCALAADFEAVSDEGEVRVDVVENGPARGGLPAAVGLPDVRGEEVEPAACHVGLDRKVSVVLVLAVPGKVLKRSLHDEGAVGAAAAENAGL